MTTLRLTDAEYVGAIAGAWDKGYEIGYASCAPAIRSGPDSAWVAVQLAKRAAYVRSVAPLLGLDPAEAVRIAEAGGWPDLMRAIAEASG
jgi:hypothetical protein